jgi:SHS family lactate transporter-like MFS transporter
LNPLSHFREMSGPQRRAFAASFLGWMLDAFDFFLLVMVIRHVAASFHAEIKAVSYAIFLTLAMRPVGALLFGFVADRYGRRPALMGSILLYAFVELLSGFAPSLGWFLVLRAVFGIGMGGEWGVGASLAMESIPAKSRGALSGILQQGYPAGYLLAALAYWVIFPWVGWRGMFIVGALPALLVLFIQSGVEESPAWIQKRAEIAKGTQAASLGLLATLRTRWPLFLYMVALMTAFNCFSHGTQDLYPSAFLEKQRGLSTTTVSKIAIVYNVGAITGGMLFGAFSQRIGRRRAIVLAALLALPIIPFWIGPTSAVGLALGGFLIQFAAQGAWGVVPAHLNELSPLSVRGTFPGLAYQLGNLAASYLSPFQVALAERHGGDYGFALGSVAAVFAVCLAVLALVGPEAKTAELALPQP